MATAPAANRAIAGWAGLALILLACCGLSAATPYPGIAALLPTLGAALVIGAGCAAPLRECGRVLEVVADAAIGRISYSWYLWHWPVLLLAPALLGHPLGLAARVAAALSPEGWQCSPCVSSRTHCDSPRPFAARPDAVWCWAAQPLRSRSVWAWRCCTWSPPRSGVARRYRGDRHRAAGAHRLCDRRLRRGGAARVRPGPGAVAASADLKAVPSNLDPSFADVEAEQKAYMGKGCLRTPTQAGQPECATGDTASTTTVAVVGDSHAAIWNPAFQQAAADRHWRLETLAKAACPLMDLRVANAFRPLVELFEHCEQWRAEIMARLRAEHPRLVVVSAFRGYGADESLTGFDAYNQAWIDGLTRLVQQLRGTGAKVLVLGPVPDPHLDVPTCLSAHLDDATACMPRRSKAVNRVGIAAESAATATGGGQYADLTDLFCTTDRCPVIVGNTLVYVDSSHLTFEYSRLLGPVMGALAERALAQG